MAFHSRLKILFLILIAYCSLGYHREPGDRLIADWVSTKIFFSKFYFNKVFNFLAEPINSCHDEVCNSMKVLSVALVACLLLSFSNCSLTLNHLRTLAEDGRDQTASRSLAVMTFSYPQTGLSATEAIAQCSGICEVCLVSSLKTECRFYCKNNLPSDVDRLSAYYKNVQNSNMN